MPDLIILDVMMPKINGYKISRLLKYDNKYKDMDSSIIVKEVVKMMKDRGYQVGNIDVSITLEKPKLKDYILEMRKNLASLLEVNLDSVSIKAGTNEQLDDIGHGLAVKAESIVLLKEKE